jgi:hypothetical protein
MRVGDVLAANDVEPEDAVGTKTSEMPRKRCLIQSHRLVSQTSRKNNKSFHLPFTIQEKHLNLTIKQSLKPCQKKQ